MFEKAGVVRKNLIEKLCTRRMVREVEGDVVGWLKSLGHIRKGERVWRI